jgi:hypothetical protein
MFARFVPFPLSYLPADFRVQIFVLLFRRSRRSGRTTLPGHRRTTWNHHGFEPAVAVPDFLSPERAAARWTSSRSAVYRVACCRMGYAISHVRFLVQASRTPSRLFTCLHSSTVHPAFVRIA